MDNSYKKIAEHYSKTFEKYGATPQGLDWDNQENLDKRYKVMRGIIKGAYESVLDFGCGYGGFYKYLHQFNDGTEYTGIDINENLIEEARKLHYFGKFGLGDIHNEEFWKDFNKINYYKDNFDWIICNGTFTVKRDLTQEEMTNFMCSTLEKLWTKTNKGIAFNCMSKVLDYERNDLFHVSFDELSMWVYDNLSSKFTIRQDYGLREFTMYVYK